MATRLTDGQIDDALARLEGWRAEGASLRRDFGFGDFASAFGFMSAVATVAAELNHHPDWSNSYSRVSIVLSTHDVGGISDLDVRLAERADLLCRGFGGVTDPTGDTDPTG